MDLPQNESQNEVRTIWYPDPVNKTLFTKHQVFFICFIIPSIIFWLPGLFLMNPGPRAEFYWTAGDLMVLILYLLLPFSFFVPARVIGGEFKNYGYYGALTSIGINLVIFVIYTNGLYF